jgi:hypothetical protein
LQETTRLTGRELKGYQLVTFEERHLLVGGWNPQQCSSDWVLQFHPQSTVQNEGVLADFTTLPTPQDWCAAHTIAAGNGRGEQLWVMGCDGADDTTGEGTRLDIFEGGQWRKGVSPPVVKQGGQVPAFFTLRGLTYAIGSFETAVGYRWQPELGAWEAIEVPAHFATPDSGGNFVTAVLL